MNALFYVLGLGALVAVAFKAGQNKARREASRVEGELVPLVSLTLPSSAGLLVLSPDDPEWCQALGYHLRLAACRRELGI